MLRALGRNDELAHSSIRITLGRFTTQEEVDYFWQKLTADGGEESQCGWLKDKFGLSWQVTPTVLIDMLHDKDQEKSGRVMQAMLQMQKIDIPKLKAAYRGK